MGAEKLQLYLHDWGQGTRGRRFHLLTASPPGSQIHPHEFLNHNKAWTVTHGCKPPPSIHPPHSLEGREDEAEQNSMEEQKAKAWLLEQELAMAMENRGNHKWNTWHLKKPQLEINSVCASKLNAWGHYQKQRQLRYGLNVWTGDGIFGLM